LKSSTPYSIKRRLTLSVGILVSVLLIISLYFSFNSAKREVEEVYDARLGQSAKLMLLAMSLSNAEKGVLNQRNDFDLWMQRIEQLAEHDSQPTPFGHPYEQFLVFQFYRDGKLLWSSASELSALSQSATTKGFADTFVSGEQWRTFQLSFPDDKRQGEYIVAGENQSIREEIINEIALSTLVEQLFLLPTLLVVLLWLIRKYFKPIDQLRIAMAQRSAHCLDRIHVADQSIELQPLVDAINTLLVQLELAWQKEKRFTRAAAHELKTPLTILRLNVENAMQTEDPKQRERDLHNLLLGIDRTDRLIHQLLTLAKVDGSSPHSQITTVRLKPLLQQIIADLVPLALTQQQEISLKADTAEVLGDPALLEVLFRNLVDNAIRYSGHGSKIQLQLKNQPQQVEVLICDNGEAIPDTTRERIFEAFYRGHSDQGNGAGLGMSICKDIVAVHNAELVLLPRANHKNTFLVSFAK